MGLHFQTVTRHVNNLMESLRRQRKVHGFTGKRLAVRHAHAPWSHCGCQERGPHEPALSLNHVGGGFGWGDFKGYSADPVVLPVETQEKQYCLVLPTHLVFLFTLKCITLHCNYFLIYLSPYISSDRKLKLL